MILLPPISTRTDTLFPCTTPVRSPAWRGGSRLCRESQGSGHGWRYSRRFGRRTHGNGTNGPICTDCECWPARRAPLSPYGARSEEHTSELQSLMRNSDAVVCLKKKKKQRRQQISSVQHIS